ncbi:TonB-dependent receptor [Thalassotalea sp. PLHSN55]|uniref:TonB-dependent receptor n=1 Tax=Thalassotalea sp. PLHSN55 TaxID=3435888 RepID=UPI003F860213
MKIKKRYHEKQALGATALAAALVFGSSNVYAESQNNECVAESEKCENAQSKDAMERIQVHGMRNSIYRFDKSGDPRRVADLIDTPTTITVLTQDQIQESGNTDLKDILSSQAGVTLGTGENGNAFGDRYIIRGHEARSDVFVDGLRDPGMTTRESFATERVEITKGPSSTFAGRGSSGGAVNSITKKASTSYNFGRVDASLGTDDHTRLTLDYNVSVAENAAVRINALMAEETKPGRDGIERERNGVQLSGVYEATDKLEFIADIYYLEASDVPDLGSYFDQETRHPIEDIPVYAQDTDFLDSEVTTFTLRTTYEISDNIRFYNATRMGDTENGYIATGVRGGSRAETDPVAPGADTLSLSTHQGWQQVEYFATQFNLFWDINTDNFKHKLVFGLDYSDESVDNGVYTITNNNEGNCLVEGRRGVSSGYCILDGEGNTVDNISALMNRSYERGDVDALFNIETTSIYFMDTVQLTEQSSVFFGLRQDSFEYTNDTVSRGVENAYAFKDDLYNGHLGFVYDFNKDTNVYLTYSTATNINGGESDLGANCGYGGLCGDPDQAAVASPETVENIELGTKIMLVDDALMLTAAAFRMTKKDVMESVGDSYSTLGSLNTGKNRVEGIEVGLVGDITEKLSIQMSLALMDSEVLASYDEENIGRDLSNFADESAFAQLRYQINEQWVVGTNYTYQSEMFGGQPDTAAGYDQENNRYSIVVPDYQVVNFFANYYPTESLSFRLNIGNVFDEEYWTAAYRSGSFMYLGDAQNARLTANFEF